MSWSKLVLYGKRNTAERREKTTSLTPGMLALPSMRWDIWMSLMVNTGRAPAADRQRGYRPYAAYHVVHRHVAGRAERTRSQPEGYRRSRWISGRSTCATEHPVTRPRHVAQPTVDGSSAMPPMRAASRREHRAADLRTSAAKMCLFGWPSFSTITRPWLHRLMAVLGHAHRHDGRSGVRRGVNVVKVLLRAVVDQTSLSRSRRCVRRMRRLREDSRIDSEVGLVLASERAEEPVCRRSTARPAPCRPRMLGRSL